MPLTYPTYDCVYYANLIFDDMKLNEYLYALKNERSRCIPDTFELDEGEKKVWNMPFCERLFSERFHENFNEQLNEKDREKIRKNNSFM